MQRKHLHIGCILSVWQGAKRTPLSIQKNFAIGGFPRAENITQLAGVSGPGNTFASNVLKALDGSGDG